MTIEENQNELHALQHHNQSQSPSEVETKLTSEDYKEVD